MIWQFDIVAAFLMSIVFSGIVIPQILLISFRKKLFDKIDNRKIHTSKVPRLGGIAFVPVILFTLALLVGINLSAGYDELRTLIDQDAKIWSFSMCTLLLLYVVGMADDLIGVRYRAKFVVQIACAIMLLAAGLNFNNFGGLLFLNTVPNWVAYPFTVLFVVFVINSINLIDGIDGLASGLSSVAVAFYTVIFYFTGEYAYAIVSISTLGVLIQFFYYNVFGDPEKKKKIFMGDTGSLTIGIILCILTLKIISTPTKTWNMNMMVAACSPLLIPGFDVVRVYLYRIRTGANPFLPDKNHIHHRLLALGMSQRRVMIFILCISFGATICNILMSYVMNVNLILLIDCVAWVAFVISISRLTERRNRRLAQKQGK